MARPKAYTEKRYSVNYRIPKELHDKLKEAADDRDVTMNWLVIRALEEFLDRLIPAEELRLTRDRT